MKRTEKFADVAEGFDEFKKLNLILDRLNELAEEVKRISESLYHIARYDDMRYDQEVHREIDRIFIEKEEHGKK